MHSSDQRRIERISERYLQPMRTISLYPSSRSKSTPHSRWMSSILTTLGCNYSHWRHLMKGSSSLPLDCKLSANSCHATRMRSCSLTIPWSTTRHSTARPSRPRLACSMALARIRTLGLRWPSNWHSTASSSIWWTSRDSATPGASA